MAEKLHQLVSLIGIGVAGYLLLTWMLPKFQRPLPAPVKPGVAAVPVAKSATAVHQSMGPIKDYNLAGLAIEELESYPTAGGVTLSF